MAKKDQHRGRSKLNIAERTYGMTPDEKRRLYKLMRQNGFRKKNEAEQAALLERLIATVESNSGRREYETRFAHNVGVATKHETRRRFKVRWKLYTFFIVGGIMIALALYLLWSYVLVIENITVTGSERYLASDIVECSGINVGDKLFSLSIKGDEVADAITERFSYIKDVKLRRRIPDTVELVLTEETPVFIAELHDKYIYLSEELRVLEIADKKSPGDYIGMKLPDMRIVATAGHMLEMDESMLEVIKTAAAAVCTEEMRDGTNYLDVSDRFNISISYDDRFLLELGNINDIEIKLRIAFEIMKESMFSGGNKGIIYLENVNRPSAQVDNSVKLY